MSPTRVTIDCSVKTNPMGNSLVMETKTLLFEQTADLIKNISFARKREIAEAKLSKVNHQRKGQKTLKCQ